MGHRRYARRRRATKESGSVKFLLIFFALIAAAVAVAYATRNCPLHDRYTKVVEIKLGRGVVIRPEIAGNRPRGTENFTDMVSRLRPYAAINGTYYDKDWKPLGDILIDGKLVNRGGQHHAIAITKDGRVDFIKRSKGKFNWAGYKYGLACGPRLIHNGKIALDPVADGFSPAASKKYAWRSGVGKTADGRLLLVTENKSVKLSEFADIMLELGAVEAMNLDGGGACGLYHNGSIITTPPLYMTNLLVVYKK